MVKQISQISEVEFKILEHDVELFWIVVPQSNFNGWKISFQIPIDEKCSFYVRSARSRSRNAFGTLCLQASKMSLW